VTESHASGLQSDVGEVRNRCCSAVHCIQGDLPMDHQRPATGSKQIHDEATHCSKTATGIHL